MATRSTPNTTRGEELSERAWSDYSLALGTTIACDLVYVLGTPMGDDEVHAPVGEPFKVRVVETPEAEVVRWMDEQHLDPTWEVEPAYGETRLDFNLGYWIYGPEYSL